MYVIIGTGISRRRSGPGENNENMNPGRVFETMQFTLQFCRQYNIYKCDVMLQLILIILSLLAD